MCNILKALSSQLKPVLYFWKSDAIMFSKIFVNLKSYFVIPKNILQYSCFGPTHTLVGGEYTVYVIMYAVLYNVYYELI